MSNNLADIANAIPPALMTAARNTIQDPTQKMIFTKEIGEDGRRVKVPKKDKDGVVVMCPGGIGDVSTTYAAFDAIKDLTLDPEVIHSHYTYADIASKANYKLASDLTAAVDLAVAAGKLESWVDISLSSLGIELEDTLKAKLESLIPDYGFDQQLINDVWGVDIEVKLRFPLLNEGEVDRAIRMRDEKLRAEGDF